MPFQPDEMTLSTLKGFVDRLARFHKSQPQPITWPPKRAWCQEAIAQALGFPNFHAAHTALSTPLPPPSQSWRLKVDERSSFNRALARTVKDGETSILIPHTTLLSHLVLFAAEAERKKVLEDLHAQAPCFWIQGPLALPSKASDNSLTIGPHQGWNSLFNTFSPTASAGELVELTASLMHKMGPDNAVWSGRAISLLTGILFSLVYRRDHHDLRLDLEVLREHLILENIQKLSKRRDLPPKILQPVRSYLRSLPGYQENLPQSQVTLEQHGFLQMQFTQALTSLEAPAALQLKANLHIQLARGAEESTTALSLLLKDWMDREGFGVLILDGMRAESSLFDWLVEHMANLTQRGKAVVVATGGLAELPDDHTRIRLMGRIESAVCLGASIEMERARQGMQLHTRLDTKAAQAEATPTTIAPRSP